MASLIEPANQRGNARELQLLQSQWVHRYGVDSMPVQATPISAELSTEELSSSEPLRQQPVTEQFVTEQLVSEQLLAEQPVPEMPVSEQVVTELPISEQPITQELVAEEHAGVANGSSPEPREDNRDDESDDASRPFDSDRTAHAVPSIPAPPISTPRSLRRWLPGADDQLPKAS